MKDNRRILDIGRFDADVTGTISHFNGFLFDEIRALQADCEGALAVGRLARFGSGSDGYDTGAGGVEEWGSVVIGKHENPHEYPTVLLGGAINHQESTAVRVYSGHVVMKESYKLDYHQGAFRFECEHGIRFAEDEVVEAFFAEAREKIGYVSGILPQGNSKLISEQQLKRIDRLNAAEYRNEKIITADNLLIFNVDCDPDGSIQIGELYFDDAILDYDTVVINVPAKRVDFSGGAVFYNGEMVESVPRDQEKNKILRNVAGRVVYNFVNANEVKLSGYAVIGSIIAPRAEVVGEGGSINGMLAADSLLQTGGMELHAFRLGGDHFWEGKVDEPTGRIELVKADAQNPAVTLSGALFSLCRLDEQGGGEELLQSGLETAADGALVIEGLVPGRYKLVETQPPYGYQLPQNAEILFEISLDEKGEVIIMDIIYITNQRLRGSVQILKVNAEDVEIRLEGAIFSLYKQNDESASYELMNSGLATIAGGILIIEGLLPGNYKLVETQAPDGYYLAEGSEVFFSVALGEDGQIIEIQPIYVPNTPLGSIRVIKTDSENTGITLEGAIFDLYRYNEEGNIYELLKTGLLTDSQGAITITDLQPGRYKLVETQAPNGYELPADPETHFTITL